MDLPVIVIVAVEDKRRVVELLSLYIPKKYCTTAQLFTRKDALHTRNSNARPLRCYYTKNIPIVRTDKAVAAVAEEEEEGNLSYRYFPIYSSTRPNKK